MSIFKMMPPSSCRQTLTSSTRARRFAPLVLLIAALIWLPSCSLLLDFDECSADSDCEAAGVCNAGICEAPPTVDVVNIIAEDTTWTADKVYVLKKLITVTSPAVLTIEPGTRIIAERKAALVFLAGARLEAEGTRQDPIVFSSAQPVGRRRAGDWGGVAMIGKAKVSREDFTLRINDIEQKPFVGGTDDTWNCGTLKYTRIEFGGGYVDGDNALNGLTLAGCGSETDIDYVQVHKGDDDNLEIFGGTVDIRHVVLTRATDDPFDIDTGWRGSAQFLAIQQDPVGNNSLEIGNLEEEPAREPHTNIKFYNYTLIGGTGEGDVQRGVHLKEGAQAFLSHGIIMGHHTTAIEVSGPESTQFAQDGETVVKNTLFYDVGMDGTNYFPVPDTQTPDEPLDTGTGEADAGAGDASGGSDSSSQDIADDDTSGDDSPGDGVNFDAAAYFTQAAFNNVFGEDPGIERPYDLENPSWVPTPEFTTGSAVTPPPANEGFDPTGVYLGAFAPNAIPWTEGWTDYPQN